MDKTPKERLEEYRELLKEREEELAEQLRIVIDAMLDSKILLLHYMADNVRDKMRLLDLEDKT